MTIRLGLRENAPQFAWLVLVNAFVGAMAGLERSVLPLVATDEFHLVGGQAVLSFVATFGLTKSLANAVAGGLADRGARKPLLVAGWLVAVPVPFVLMWAPSWGWILVANALLGVSQGLTWSTTVVMKIDLAGPRALGLAMGINEFAGYVAVAASALATGLVAARWGARPHAFALGVGYVAAGLVLSIAVVRDTLGHARAEAAQRADGAPTPRPRARDVFWRTTLLDRDLSSVCQAGLVNNLNDAVAWGLFPLLFAAAGLDAPTIAALAALYPATWGIAQLGAGALSDRVGRRPLIATGMAVQALGLGVIAGGSSVPSFAAGSVILGLGTAMVYPTLLASVGDVAHPSWRASAVGVYRLWRDLGYVAGALVAGAAAEAFRLSSAVRLVAVLTLASGVVAQLRMRPRSAAPPT